MPSDTRPVPYPPGDALVWLHRRRGPVIDIGVGGLGYVLLLGPEANEFVFANSDAFSWAETFQILVPVDGPTALIVSDGEDHRRRRSVVQPALNHRRIGHYVQSMVATADAVIDSWQVGRKVDLYQAFRSAIRRTNIDALFGPRMARHSDFLGEQLQPLLDLTHLPPQVVDVQRRLRTRNWRRAMAAQARVHDVVDTEIARARAEQSPDDGLLSAMVAPGSPLSSIEIRDQVLSLIADGYETTSGAMTWAVHALLTVPGVWDAAAFEVGEVLGGRAPTDADLGALSYLNGVVHETLRLYTPGVISARKVKRYLTFAGHRIRAGRLIIFSPYVTHRLPEIWPEPTQFMPQRWDAGSPHYRRPAPHEFIPFSGGLHRCIGAAMATTEMMVFLARLVARTELRLPPQRVRARHYAALRPMPGLTAEIIGRTE